MKKTLIILTFLIIPFLNFAQRFDGLIVFGMSASQIEIDGLGGYNKIGGTFGLHVTHQITKVLEFQTGINYIGKGARNDFNQPGFYFKTQLDYVQVPAQLNYIVYNKISVSAGIYFGYLIRGYNITGGTTTDESELDLFNFEACSYLSLNYHIFDKIVFNFGHSYSLLPIKTGGSSWWFNNVLTVTGTYRMSNAKK
jgi:hypothetical protein